MGMVTKVTNLARNGVGDWLVQRVSAVVLASYVLFLTGWLVLGEPVTFGHWYSLFAHTGMRIFSLAALLALVAHSWVGMWTIAGDYLNARALGRAAGPARFAFFGLCVALMFVYVVWGVQILWGL